MYRTNTLPPDVLFDCLGRRYLGFFRAHATKLLNTCARCACSIFFGPNTSSRTRLIKNRRRPGGAGWGGAHEPTASTSDGEVKTWPKENVTGAVALSARLAHSRKLAQKSAQASSVPAN